MEKKEIDLRGKSSKEILSEYSNVAKKIQECKKNYNEKQDLINAMHVYKKVSLQKTNNS